MVRSPTVAAIGLAEPLDLLTASGRFADTMISDHRNGSTITKIMNWIMLQTRAFTVLVPSRDHQQTTAVKSPPYARLDSESPSLHVTVDVSAYRPTPVWLVPATLYL